MKQKQPHLAFIFLIFIAYFPMLSGMMAIKSDSLLVSYPIFYFFGNQLQQGNIPFWHFNLNGGFPMHAEVGSLFWNIPFWFFPLLSKSLYAYTLEIGLHIIIASIGIFKIAQYLKLSRLVASFMMFCYVCSGFFVAHLQHTNNIFESAYVPFVLLFFLKTLFVPNLKHSIYLSISLFFLINSGYPGFPISMFYFLLFIFIGILISSKANIAFIIPAIKYLSVAVILAALLSLPLIESYIEIAGYYFRANNFNAETISHSGGMTLRSLLSFFWPFAAPVDAGFYKTDVAWNNIYIGVIFAAFFLLALNKLRHPLKWPFFFAGFMLLLFSFQGNIKHFFYGFLPLLGLVRSNGEFRIYFILVAIIIGSLGLENLLEKDKPTLKKVFIFFILLQIIAIGIIFSTHSKDVATIFKRILNGSLKTVLEHLNAPFLIVVESVFNVCLLAIAIVFIKKKRYIFILLCLDLLISFFFNLPFSGLSTKSTLFIQSNITQSISQLNKFEATNKSLLVNIDSNSKYIVAPAQFVDNNIKIDYSNYPAMFKTYSNLLKTGAIRNFEKQQAVFFTKQQPDSNYLQSFVLKGNTISFDIFCASNDSITLFQNYHANWNCEMDGQKAAITKTNDGLMELPVKRGLHHFVFSYLPKKAIIAFFISIFVWLLSIAYLLKKNGHPLKTVDA